MTETLVKEKKTSFPKTLKKKIGQAEGIIIGTLLLYFFFFGWIANCGNSDVQNNPQDFLPDNILYVYTTFFNFEDLFHPYGLNLPSFMEKSLYSIPVAVSLIIFILIGIYQSYREDFVVYGLKNNLWTVPIVILISWIWTSYNAGELIFLTIGRYFSHYHGYINIIVLLVIYSIAGLIGTWFKTIKQRKEAMIKAKAMKSFQISSNDEENVEIEYGNGES
ncbi:MAG: hypothetical protein ACTSYI_08455 [Promethearchaeota archaeon]